MGPAVMQKAMHGKGMSRAEVIREEGIPLYEGVDSIEYSETLLSEVMKLEYHFASDRLAKARYFITVDHGYEKYTFEYYEKLVNALKNKYSVPVTENACPDVVSNEVVGVLFQSTELAGGTGIAATVYARGGGARILPLPMRRARMGERSKPGRCCPFAVSCKHSPTPLVVYWPPMG